MNPAAGGDLRIPTAPVPSGRSAAAAPRAPRDGRNDSHRETAACGRFAPSPTGPLHFGSLVAALGSLLSARRAPAATLAAVRIEDLDTPRNSEGASDSILHDLERLAMHWDGEVVSQSARTVLYGEALETLADRGWTFDCGCSRRDLVG